MICHTVNRGVKPTGGVGEWVRVDFAKGGLIAYQIPAHGLDAELALE
jgi:hypothetical protein